MSTAAGEVAGGGESLAVARITSPARPSVDGYIDIFACTAERWIALWEGRIDVRRAAGAECQRLERELGDLAEALLACDLRTPEDLMALLRAFAFFDARQPWMQAGRFGHLRGRTSYSEAVLLLSAMLRDGRRSPMPAGMGVQDRGPPIASDG